MSSEEEMTESKVLRQIANLTAQRGFKRDADWNETILDCIAMLLSRAGYADQVDIV